MNIRWVFGFLIVSAIAILLLFGKRHEAPLNDQANIMSDVSPSATPTMTPIPTAIVTATPSASPSTNTETLSSPVPDVIPFERRLDELAACLKLRGIKAGEEAENLDFFSLNASLSNKFGGLKDQVDLWASTEIQTPNGVRRRIFADFRQGQPSLRYFEIQKDGSQKNLELSQEQMTEPSESLIASLESDGQILGRARERLVTYEYGQQIQVREVDGKVYSFKVVQGPKTFSCNRDSSKNLNCSCAE